MTNETTEQNFDKDTIRNMVQKSIYGQVNTPKTNQELSESLGIVDLPINEQEQIQESISEWADKLKNWFRERKAKGLGVKVLESETDEIRYFFVRNEQTNDFVALVYDGNRYEDKIEFSSLDELEDFVSQKQEEGYKLLKREGSIRNAFRVVIRSFGIIKLVMFGVGITLIAVMAGLGIIPMSTLPFVAGISIVGDFLPGWLMVRYTGAYPDEPADEPELRA